MKKTFRSSHAEGSAAESNGKAEVQLSPTPTDDPADPLNWPLKLKIGVLVQVSLLASLGGMNTAIINPAYVPLSKEFGITTVTASYQTTVVIALNGVAPFIWIPLADVYGRRPVYLASTLLGFVSALGCAYTSNFGQLLAARVFNGLFPSAFALGATTVVDVFFMHQRGRALGFFALLLTTGSHLAPIVGGLTGQFLGWRWCFKMAAIFDAVMLVVIFFGLPETLYIRTTSASSDIPPAFSSKTYLQRLKLVSHNPALRLRLSQFVWPSLKMAKYPSVLFPAIYYAAQYGFASILPAVTVASIFTEFFHWDTLQIGLGYGVALTIGSCLGELAAGIVVDAIVRRARHRLGPGAPDPPPEIRLRAIWTGEALVPTGLLIYGFTLQYHAPWIVPLVGMGIACFGLQVITTTCYTYSIDCYRAKSSEVAQLFNLIRQTFGMTFAFYTIRLAGRIGYQFTFVFFAIMGSVLGFVPIVVLMFRGRQIRERLGLPDGGVVVSRTSENQDAPFSAEGEDDQYAHRLKL